MEVVLVVVRLHHRAWGPGSAQRPLPRVPAVLLVAGAAEEEARFPGAACRGREVERRDSADLRAVQRAAHRHRLVVVVWRTGRLGETEEQEKLEEAR